LRTSYIIIYGTLIGAYVIREIKIAVIFTSAFSSPVLSSKIWSSNWYTTTVVTNHKNKHIHVNTESKNDVC